MSASLLADRPLRPRVLSESPGPERAERQLAIDPELRFFEGHFPVQPVVPGFVQLAWVLEAARELLGEERTPRRIEALKFRRVIQPGDRVVLRVARPDGAPSLDFEVEREGETVSCGRLVLGAPR